MADYSMYQKCGCSYYSSGHDIMCPEHPDFKDFLLGEQNNLVAVYDFPDSGMQRLQHFECKRGCGCLVWDVDAHVKNVCVSDGK